MPPARADRLTAHDEVRMDQRGLPPAVRLHFTVSHEDHAGSAATSTACGVKELEGTLGPALVVRCLQQEEGSRE